MPEIVKLGSIYFDTEPQEVGAKYSMGRISVGNTAPGKELSWVKLKNGLLMGAQCACVSTSWQQLDAYGLIFGILFSIDDRIYRIRSPKAGASTIARNEWDDAVKEIGEDNDIWHWRGMYFWGQEALFDVPSRHVNRGCKSAWYWTHRSAEEKSADVGFRPVAEPLLSPPKDYNSMVGSVIFPMDRNFNAIPGKLISYTDYDLVLEPSGPLSSTNKWAVQEGAHVIVDRASVCWLRDI